MTQAQHFIPKDIIKDYSGITLTLNEAQKDKAEAIRSSKDSGTGVFMSALSTYLERLRLNYTEVSPALICFAIQRIPDTHTYQKFACAFGDELDLEYAIYSSMLDSKECKTYITKSFSTFVLENSKANDKKARRLMPHLLAYLDVNEKDEPVSQEEKARYELDQIAAEHPDRESRIPLIKARAKEYRRSGLKDMQILFEREVADIIEAVERDEHEAIDRQIQADNRRANLDEARRIKRQMAEEQQEMLRLEHDYESMGRRVRNYKTMIERLTKEMEALQEEQRKLQRSIPQFDPNSAAKQKRRQLAERKRERAALKKKGKEDISSGIRSCSPLISHSA